MHHEHPTRNLGAYIRPRADPDGTTPVTIRLTHPILAELERRAAAAGEPRSTHARHLLEAALNPHP